MVDSCGSNLNASALSVTNHRPLLILVLHQDLFARHTGERLVTA